MTDVNNGPRIVNLPKGDVLASSIAEMDRNLPQMKKYHENRAILYVAFFNKLVAEGMDEDLAASMTESEFFSDGS